jgi:hypothetical protein
MRVEGGSVGFQIGASETDIVLLVMNEGGMKHLLSDKFTIGGEATAAAGPLVRDASAQTDAMMRGGDAVLFTFARAVRRHFTGRRNTASGRGYRSGTLWPRRDQSCNSDGRFQTPEAAMKFEHALHRDSPERSQ